jgi:hypothetical protein
MLASLPVEVVGEIVAWLTPRDVRSLALTTKPLLEAPFHDACVRQHFRLCIPPDPQHCAPLVAACKLTVASSRSLPVRAVLGLPSQLDVLQTIGIHDHVEKIEIDARRVFQYEQLHPDNLWQGMTRLSYFRRLVHLTIASRGGYGRALDIEIIARAVPRLEVFSAAFVRLEHEDAFGELPYLRRLNFSTARFQSWRFASGLTRLDHVECDEVNLERGSEFATCRPLKVLNVASFALLPDEFVRAVEQIHLPVLESLRLDCIEWNDAVTLDLAAQASPNLRELAIVPIALTQGIGVLTSMTQLRFLHLWWEDSYGNNNHNQGIDDVSPLAALVQLETLKVRLSNRATTCRPLRTLVCLRELHLVDGWLQDFVDCLPQLEKLSVEEFGALPRERTFQQRDRHSGDTMPLSSCPRLYSMYIGEYVAVNGYAMALIRNARSLKYDVMKSCGPMCFMSTSSRCWRISSCDVEPR